MVSEEDVKDLLKRKFGEVTLSIAEQDWLLTHLSTRAGGEQVETTHLINLARNIDRETRKQLNINAFLKKLVAELDNVKFDLELVINTGKLQHNYSEVCKFLQYERNLSSWDALLGADLETIRELVIDCNAAYETDTKALEDFVDYIKFLQTYHVGGMHEQITKIKDTHQKQFTTSESVTPKFIRGLIDKLQGLQALYDCVKELSKMKFPKAQLDPKLEYEFMDYYKILSDAWLSRQIAFGFGQQAEEEFPTELVFVDESGNLEVNLHTLENTESKSPNQLSRTVSFVGPSGSGKSTLICYITPECCRKPARAGFQQTIPTTGNVHVFDTFIRVRDDPSSSETHEIRFLDVEGLDGTRHVLPKDVKHSMTKENAERLARDRWQVVQELPRLCYAISNVIVYVDTTSLSRDFSEKFGNFCFQTQKRMGNSWPVDMIIVFNMADHSLAKTPVEELTEIWCSTHDQNQYFRSRYNAIHCIALPRIGSIQDEQLWQEQMEKLKSLIFNRVEAQIRLRISKKASFNRSQWCRLTRNVVAKFHGNLDPATILADDLIMASTTVTRCFWKFKNLFVDSRVPGAHDAEAQYLLAFDNTVRLLALIDLLNSPGMLKESLSSSTSTLSYPPKEGENTSSNNGNSSSEDSIDSEQGDAVNSRLYALRKFLKRRAPCLAQSSLWLDANNDPIRCIAEAYGHSDTHITNVNLIEQATGNGLLLYRLLNAFELWVSKKIFSGTVKTWKGNYCPLRDLPSVPQMKAIYDNTYKTFAQEVKFPDLFSAVASFHKKFTTNAVKSQDETCFICLSNPVTRVLACTHSFCAHCVLCLHKFHLTCPICDKPVGLNTWIDFFPLSVSPSTPISAACVKEILQQSTPTDEVRVVTVLGRFSIEAIKQMMTSSLKNDPWVRFFWCLSHNIAYLGNHENPRWKHCTAYKIDNFLFVHYDLELDHFEKRFEGLPIYHLTMASHCVVTGGGVRMLDQDVEWPYWKSYRHPTVFSWNDEPVLNSYAFMKNSPSPMVSPYYWSILTLEILSMELTDEFFFRCAKRLDKLFPHLSTSYILKPKALEEFLLRTTIVDIIETLFIKYHHSIFAQKIFLWLEEPEKPDDNPITKCVYTQIVHCAKILAGYYKKYSINPSAFSPETDALLHEASAQRACEKLFRRFFDGWGKKSVVDEDGRLHAWWPLVARLASLHRLELQLGSDLFAQFSFTLGTLSPDAHTRFCHVCLDMIVSEANREEYNCGHSICLKCSQDVSNANDRSIEFLAKKINTIVCPVCSKVTLSRSREFIMHVQSIDDERLEAINKMLIYGNTEFTTISLKSFTQLSSLSTTTSSATYNGNSVIVTYFPLTLEEKETAWHENPHLLRWRMAVSAFSIFNHPNITPLLGAWGPKDPSALRTFQGELYVVTKSYSFTLQKVITGKYCSWDDCLPLLRDIASGVAMFHKIKWVYRNFEASNIAVVGETQVKMTRAILTHAGSACPESESEKIETTYKYPFVPQESPKYTSASDVFNFGQLFMQVCISALGSLKAMEEWKRGRGLQQLPPFLPDRLRQLISSCVDPVPGNRPTANHIFIQLSHECADNDRQTRFARALRGVQKWISQNNDEESNDINIFLERLRSQWNVSNFLKTSIKEFVNFIKSNHKEQLQLYVSSSSNKNGSGQEEKGEHLESTPALAYAASQDIRRFTALVADTVAEKRPQKDKVAFTTREMLEDVIFQSCADWFEHIYISAYQETDDQIVKKCTKTSLHDTVRANLGVPKYTVDLLTNAIHMLQDFNKHPSPLRKLNILHSCFKEVETVLLNTTNDLSADVKWPVILYVVFKADLPHLYSSAMMITNFFQSYQFETEALERASLHVTELTSVATYILKDLQ